MLVSCHRSAVSRVTTTASLSSAGAGVPMTRSDPTACCRAAVTSADDVAVAFGSR